MPSCGKLGAALKTQQEGKLLTMDLLAQTPSFTETGHMVTDSELAHI